MINVKIKKWGNSLGLLIPKKDIEKMKLKENQEIIIEIVENKNPLKELFGFGKNKKISKQEFLETRALLESKY